MYAIKTRSGGVYLKMKAMNGARARLACATEYRAAALRLSHACVLALRRLTVRSRAPASGDLSAFERDENSAFQRERNGGNYGSGTQELQRRNYVERKELERKRTAMFNDAIALFNDKKYEEALIVFENIVGLEPKNYIGDNFEKVTSIFRVAQYNIACCYSCLGAVEPGLEALQVAMSVGFDDYNKIRKDPSLRALQASERFKPLLEKYDESFINDAAFKAFASLFGGKK